VKVCVESETLSYMTSHARAVLGSVTPMRAHIRLHASCCRRRVCHILMIIIPLLSCRSLLLRAKLLSSSKLSSTAGCSSCAFSSNGSGHRRPLGHLVFKGLCDTILNDWDRPMRARRQSVGRQLCYSMASAAQRHRRPLRSQPFRVWGP
jgi:hypothetical protein